MAKHFLKTLIIFIGMIVLGLIGVYLASNYDKDANLNNTAASNKIQIAK